MDAELKAKWIEALRSGKYRKTKGKLCTPTRKSFCCLGVLVEIQGVNILQEFPYEADRSTAFLPLNLSGGLTPEVTYNLSKKNDGTGEMKAQSFSEIADYIEKNI